MNSSENKKQLQTKEATTNGTNGAATTKDKAIQDSVTTKKMVTKRDGRAEQFSTDKLRKRLEQLLDGLAKEYLGLDACLQKVSAYAHSGKFSNYISNSQLCCLCRDHDRRTRQSACGDGGLSEHAPPRLWQAGSSSRRHRSPQTHEEGLF